MNAVKKISLSYEYGEKSQPYYKKKAARDMSGSFARIGVRPKRVDFEFGYDNECWSCPNPQAKGRYLIHMGLGFFTEFDDGTPVFMTEKEWNTYVRYVLTHEEGHILYTTDRAWTMAIENGTRNIVAYIANRALGQAVRIPDDRTMLLVVESVRANAHLMINITMIKKMVHFVCNAIEDGRMERIMAISRPGFKADLRMFRGKYWMHTPMTDDLDPTVPTDLFAICLSQVLTLATTGLWQKGFMTRISGTKTEQIVRPLMPKIQEGVMSRSCRKGMAAALEIIDELAPLFYDACTCDAKDFEKALDDLINQLAKALPDMGQNGQTKSQYSADEKNDAEAAKQDEAEAKAKQNDQKPANGQNDGQDENDQNGQPKNGNAGKDDQRGQKQSLSFNIFSDGDESEEEAQGTAKASGTAKNASDNGSANGNPDNSSQQSFTSDNMSGDPSTVSGGRSGSKGQSVTKKGDDEEAVIAAMEAAAENASAESSFAMEATKNTGTPKRKETEDNSSVLDFAGDISDICTDFIEQFRRYNLTEDLPVDIAAECRTARAKYEHYFMSRKKPSQRGARTGRIDPRSISRVVMRNLDVFELPGEDNSFSGCIYVLVDNSGSMGGNKKWNALAICARLEEIFKGLVPLKIVAFDSTEGTNYEIIKNWNDDFQKNCSWNYLMHSRCGGGTPTTESLLIAQKELESRTEKHKMILLITDENARYSGEKLPGAITHIRKQGTQLTAAYVEEGLADSDKRSFEYLFGKADALAVPPEELCRAILPVVRKFTGK